MKKLTSAAIWVAICILPLLAQAQLPTVSGPEISFKNKKLNLGKVLTEKQTKAKLVFENTGDEPLVLDEIIFSCDCLDVDWPDEPISPGKTGVIKVRFAPDNRMGRLQKSLHVMSNAINSYEEVVVFANIEPSRW